MRIAIPTHGRYGLEDQVNPHFGRAPTFTIFDERTGSLEIVENASEHFGGSGLPPQLLSKKGVDALLCSGIGPRAVQAFQSMGIRVFVGASGTVSEALEAFRSGSLREATDADACAEHRH